MSSLVRMSFSSESVPRLFWEKEMVGGWGVGGTWGICRLKEPAREADLDLS